MREDLEVVDALQEMLQHGFWLPRRRLYRIRERRPLLRRWQHWWQTHALAARLDAYDRTGAESVRAQAYALVDGMRTRGRGRLTNDFYDDMGWLALELLRMPGLEQDVARLVAAIRTGAAPEGGVAWATGHRHFRNTPATGVAAITALRWGTRVGDPALVDWGLELVRWLRATVVTEDGLVHDGQVVRPGLVVVNEALYSYNFGLVVGAELEAHAVTGDSDHLDRARRVADAAIAFMTDPPTGVWRDEGGGDRALFRAVLARQLVELSRVTGDRRWAGSVRIQAEAIARLAPGPIGPDWTAPAERRTELSAHVAAVLVTEAAVRG